MKTIFFVAPLTSGPSSPSFSPAGNKKIILILNMLAKLGWSVVFLNSLPVACSNRTKIVAHTIKLKNNIDIQCYSFHSSYTFSVSYLINLFKCSQLFDNAVNIHGKPCLIWAYNGYSIEMCIARYAFKKYCVKTILEFEDWHFSRFQFPWIRVKYLLDFFLWLLAIPAIDYSMTVNDFLANWCKLFGIPTILMPGVVSDSVSDYPHTFPIFNSPFTTCAYCGGLTVEKGAEYVLNLIDFSISEGLPLRWVITGHGPLSHRFHALSKDSPGCVNFYGYVDESTFNEIIQQVDIYLNPHRQMSGVFPFKIVEAVACGRIVVSSPLKLSDSLGYMMPSIKQLELNAKEWLELLISLRGNYLYEKDSILGAAHAVNRDWSQSSLSFKVNKILMRYQ